MKTSQLMWQNSWKPLSDAHYREVKGQVLQQPWQWRGVIAEDTSAGWTAYGQSVQAARIKSSFIQNEHIKACASGVFKALAPSLPFFRVRLLPGGRYCSLQFSFACVRACACGSCSAHGVSLFVYCLSGSACSFSTSQWRCKWAADSQRSRDVNAL